jgi:uncharacterized lipoprotein YmbA
MRTIALLPTLFVLACSSPGPTTTRYLLPTNVPMGTVRMEPPVRVGLDRVDVAPYLGEPGVVVETEARQVRPARYHQWAEPLSDGLRRFLQAEISNALGYDVSDDPKQKTSWDRSIDVIIDRLHGNLSGEAQLVARWRIVPEDGVREAVTYRFAATEPLPREGYPGLVDAEITLVRNLAVAIAESLRDGP